MWVLLLCKLRSDCANQLHKVLGFLDFRTISDTADHYIVYNWQYIINSTKNYVLILCAALFSC